MSSYIDDFGDPDSTPRAGVLSRLAHLLGPITVLITIETVLHWANYVPRFLDTGLWVIAYSIVWIFFAHQYLARICIQCMKNVPPDAPIRAQRRRWLLYYAHFSMTFKYAGVVICVGIAAFPLRSWLYPHHVPGDGLGWWLIAPVDVAFILMMIAMYVHHPLSPWCPWCRWGEGGHHEDAPEPTPDPAGVKTR